MYNILVVEDDLNLTLGIEYALNNEGYAVHTANTLKLASQLTKDNKYDLILLDVMLPDGQGYELCKEVRNTSDVGIIFLTACDNEVNVVMGLDIGGDDYITKPFRIRELLSRINAVIRRKSSNTKSVSTEIISDSITVFISENKVTYKDNPLYLTPIEYKLLITFLHHPKQILTRQQLFEQIWDIDGDFIDDNTLSVYIKRLREKIESNDMNKFIKTIRGKGYYWDMEVRRC